MGHTSTRKGSPVLLRMVPNTSHRKVMKPSQRSTSCRCSSSRTVKSFCRGTRDHVSLAGAGRGPGNTRWTTAPMVQELVLCSNEDRNDPALYPWHHTSGYPGLGLGFSSSESCSALVTFLLPRCPSALPGRSQDYRLGRYGGGRGVCMLEGVGNDTFLRFITSQFNC